MHNHMSPQDDYRAMFNCNSRKLETRTNKEPQPWTHSNTTCHNPNRYSGDWATGLSAPGAPSRRSSLSVNHPALTATFLRGVCMRNAGAKMTSLLSWFRRIYSLNTLDTRFTTSATTPLKAAADTRPASSKDARANAIASGAASPNWHTPEFFVYYVVFIVAVPLMFKTVVDVSKGRACCFGVEVQRANADSGQ